MVWAIFLFRGGKYPPVISHFSPTTTFLSPLNPKSDQNLGNDCQLNKLWLINKFSLSAPKEMSGEEYGEYGYWCQGVQG